MGTETNLVQQVRLKASELGCVLFRNNTGKLEDKRGRWVEFGLCKGSSDLIGMMPDGRFLAVECKVGTAQPRSNQIDFINLVLSKGGVAGTVWSVDEFIQLVQTALRTPESPE